MKMPQFLRARFSLMSFLLATALVCVSVSHWLLSHESRELKRELAQLRYQVGQVDVVDPSQVYVKQIPSYEPFVWKYRVYLPPETSWMLNTSGSASGPVSGLETITVSLSKLVSSDEWIVQARSSSGSLARGRVAPKLVAQLNERIQLAFNSRPHHQYDLAPTDAVVLLRISDQVLAYLDGRSIGRFQMRRAPPPVREESLQTHPPQGGSKASATSLPGGPAPEAR